MDSWFLLVKQIKWPWPVAELFCHQRLNCFTVCRLQRFGFLLHHCAARDSIHRCLWSSSCWRYWQKLGESLSDASRSTWMGKGQLQTVYPVLWNAYPTALSLLTAPGKRLKVSNYSWEKCKRKQYPQNELSEWGRVLRRSSFAALCSVWLCYSVKTTNIKT